MTSSENITKLRTLRTFIYFLNLIPDRIYYALNAEEFSIPTFEIMQGRVELENKLNSHIMSYKRDVFIASDPVERHLCANLEGAHLTTAQINVLQAYERSFEQKNVSFVAYANPIKIIDPHMNVIFSSML